VQFGDQGKLEQFSVNGLVFGNEDPDLLALEDEAIVFAAERGIERAKN